MTKFLTQDSTQIGERMKLFRDSAKLSQERMALALGGTKRGLQDNEWGRAAPNSKILVGMAQLGLNVNWLLLGEGPMLLAQTQGGGTAALDPARLSVAIAAVEGATDEQNLALGAEKRADLITLTYQELMRGGTEREADAFLARLMRLISDIAPKKPTPAQAQEMRQGEIGLTEDEKLIIDGYRFGPQKHRDTILAAALLAKNRQKSGKTG